MDKLLVVDREDKILGYEEKTKCHDKAILHRAFSVYIFNDKGQLLIQQRSKHKPLWPLYWANSCCSHPRRGEDYERAGERRIEEELGIECSLRLIDKFHYKAKYEDVGYENELCGILVGTYSGKIKADKKEVADYKWIDVKKLLKEFEDKPNKYTPWLKIGLKRYLKVKEKLEKDKKELKEFLLITSKRVNPVIYGLLEKHIDRKFHGIIDYQIKTGGKKVRAGLVVISSNLFGGKLKDSLYPAAGVEVLHNCTLIIDDIIDHSNLRRGKPTVWSKFGQSVAESAGMDYSATVFEAANLSKKPLIVSEIFAKALKTIFDGEIYDVLFEQKGREDESYVIKNRYSELREKDYYRMVGKKTAFLFESCCEMGAILADASKKQIEALGNYGFNLGIAFQVRDDFLDIFGKEKEFGKEIGRDIKERKLGNIVIYLALEQLDGKDKKKFLEIIRKEKVEDKDVKEALKLIKKTKAAQETFHLARKFAKKAEESLEFLPNNKWNKILQTLVDYAIERNK